MVGGADVGDCGRVADLGQTGLMLAASVDDEQVRALR